MQLRHSALAEIRIFAFLMAFALMASTTLALVEPNPIVAKATANGIGIYGLKVVMTNERTLERVVGLTDSNGEFLYDWANSNLKYQVGDVFTVSAGDMNQRVTYVGNIIGVLKFDYTGKCVTTSCPVCPEPVEVIKEVEKIVYVDKPVSETNWEEVVASGGLTLLFAYLAMKYLPYNGKIKIERKKRTNGTYYLVVQKYEKYKKADGTYGYRWITVKTEG